MARKKRKEKTARRFMAFMAAVCMTGIMPGMPVISHAEESMETYDADADIQENPENPDAEGQDDGMDQEERETAEEAENPEDTEEKDPGESEDKKDAEESQEKDDTGDPGEEDTDEAEDGESGGESVADEEDTSGQEESEERENTEETSEGEHDTEEEDVCQTEPAGEAEEEEISEEEDAEEAGPAETGEAGIMLLSAQAEEDEAAQEDHTYTAANGVVYHYYGYEDGTAEIYELEDYQESTWDYKALDIPAQIGDYTVTRLTFSGFTDTPWFPSVTVPETVTYMEGSIFKRTKIESLHYNAENAQTGADSESTGAFFQALIQELYIGEDVRSIPDYCFDAAKITMDELTLNVESIGRNAFYYGKTITTLTIGEDVEEIGWDAFSGNQIDNINYNAVCARSDPYGQLVSGPFAYMAISNITIGDKVTVIPEHLFCRIDYTADTLVFPDCLTAIGAMAFYGNDISIGELTIGENVTSIGTEAFARGKIGVLNYNAVDAVLDGVTVSDNHRTSFWGSAVGELRIGGQVERLPDTLFYAIGLTQDALVLPDSITYVGAFVLSHSGDNNSGKKVQIGTLEIGENITHIGRAAFGRNTYDRVAVRTVEADEPPKASVSLELPTCKETEIHGKSPYYDFFTKNTDKDRIVLLCEDFETTYGAEYYDAGKKSFVTPITESCVVCGYGETREEYSEACTVIFTDYDGRELSRQDIHKGDDATAPDDPERTGYRFTGWDKDFTDVTSDLTVRAEYEIWKYSVVFKDGGRIISEQEISYEGSATVPENPTRPEEEWGSWRFTGWSGNYTNVTKDETVTAQFEKAFNQYEVLFYDAEGTVISRQTVTHGEDAKEPEAPEKEPTAQYHYTFTGWSADTEGITGNTAFYPIYGAEMRSYTVTFMDGSTILDTQTVEYGDAALAPTAPSRLEEEWGRWKFTGWRGSYTEITKDEVVRAVFEKVFNEYEVIFCDADDNILSRQTVEHGMGAEAPEAPDIEPTEKECYIFTGWDGDVSNITGETCFHPVYETKARTYTVAFMNGDTSYDVQKVAYGSAAVTPPDPAKEEDEAYTYRFTGWDQDYSFITGDLIVRAVFEQVEKPKEEEPGNDDGDDDGEDPGDDDDGKEPDDGDDEKDSGDGDDGKEPGDGDDEKKPGDGDDGKEPGDGDDDGKEPGDGDDGKEPGNGDDDGKEPDDGNDGKGTDRKPDGEPAGDSDGSQPDGKPAEDGVKVAADPVPVIPAEIKITAQKAQPEAVQEKEAVFPVPKIPDVSIQPEERSPVKEKQQEDQQETGEAEMEEEADRQPVPFWMWLLLALGIGTGVLGVLSGLFFHRKRTVCGIILDADGNALCGIKATLAGQEEELVETRTDGDGHYMFGGLKEDTYRLCVYREEGGAMLLADISMDARDTKKVFRVIKSDAGSVETKRSGRKYQVNVKAGN